MSKKQENNGRKATNTTASSAAKKNNTANAERVTRWEKQIEKQLASMSAFGREEFALVQIAADVSKMTTAAFILDAMKRQRGLTAKPTTEAQCVKLVDDDYENEPTRTRNNHDREAVMETIVRYLFVGAAGLTAKEQAEVVRQYFKPGDRSLCEAETRAIRAALTGRKA